MHHYVHQTSNHLLIFISVVTFFVRLSRSQLLVVTHRCASFLVFRGIYSKLLKHLYEVLFLIKLKLSRTTILMPSNLETSPRFLIVNRLDNLEYT